MRAVDLTAGVDIEDSSASRWPRTCEHVRLRRNLSRKRGCFTNSRGAIDRKTAAEIRTMRWRNVALDSLLPSAGFRLDASAATADCRAPRHRRRIVRAGLCSSSGAGHGAADRHRRRGTSPMPMDERMERRFPQPVRVGDLIGLAACSMTALPRSASSGRSCARRRARSSSSSPTAAGSAGARVWSRCRSKSSASRAVNWCRSTCRAANTRRRRPGRSGDATVLAERRQHPHRTGPA